MRSAVRVLVVAMLSLAVPATASAITRHSAQRAMRAKLAHRYGAEFSRARAVWLKCPAAEIYDQEGDGRRDAYCMAEFGSGRIRRYIQGLVDADLSARVVFARHWRRHYRRCGRHNLRSWGGTGTLRTNDWDCSGDLAADVERIVNGHPRRRHVSVYWRGTNTLGFGAIARQRCRVRGHGSHRKAFCRNSLGDAFRYRFRLRR
jgi:hypothetical protein